MPRKAFGRLALVAIGLLALSGAWTAYSLSRMRDDAIADAQRNNAKVAAVLAEQATQSVQAIDLVLVELIARSSAGAATAENQFANEMSARSTFDFLRQRLASLPKAEVISVVDTEGRFLANTRAWPAPDMDIGGRYPFQYLRANEDRSLVVSLSTPNLVNGERLVYFSRRIDDPTGKFLGTATIGVRPEYFLTLYEGIASDPAAYIRLGRTDGSIIADYPASAHNLDKIPADSEWFTLVAIGGGTYRSHGRLSSVPRLAAVRPLTRYPLVITAGISEESVLAVWRKRAMISGTQSAAMAALRVLLACVLLGLYWNASNTRRELRQKSAELENANKLLDTVLTNISQGVAKFDGEDRLLFHNPAYARMYRLSPDALTAGMHISEIWNLRFAGGILATEAPVEYAKARAERLRSSGSEVRSSIDRFSDGRYILISHQPMPDGSFITTHEDITQRESANVAEQGKLEAMVRERTALIEQKSLELQDALMKQRAINEQQRSFVAMASHEFRTPLAIIDSSAQMLLRRREHFTREDINERLESVRRAVQRMTGLMESVLSMAKFEHSEIKLSVREADLYQIVFDCCFRQMEMLDSHRIRFDLDDLPRRAKIDPKLIEQVITNLLANAIKFSPEAKEVNVRATRDDGGIRIDIEDLGVGIDADDMPRMFSRYFRAKTSNGISGTGIGLHVAKMIVEMHGGKITVASVRGQGSVFSIHLPADGSNLESGGDDAPAASRTALAA